MATGKELVAEVRRLAAEQPDFIYGNQEGAEENECSYFGCAVGDSNGQACIVGQAMTNLGVDMERLEDLEKSGISAGIIAALEDGLVPIKHTGEDAQWLANVQYYQDNGRPWGEAVALASEGGYEV